jgi:hypothetical protein
MFVIDQRTNPMENPPDIIIQVDESGNITKVLSNHPIKYVVQHIYSRSGGEGLLLRQPKEQSFLGTYKAMLREIGHAPPPSKEFDAAAMLKLVCENSMLEKAFQKYHYRVDSTTRAIAHSGKVEPPVSKIMKTFYNAFVIADPKLMDAYINVQK